MVSAHSAFWDTSALAPLCVPQDATREVRSYLRKFEPVVWWGSRVEVQSAIARLHRSGNLNDADRQAAIARLLALQRSWKEIIPDEALRRLAGQILDKYPLRAADSLQLAAALTWCLLRPSRKIFICADQRLSDAAESAGFTVKRLRQIP